MPTYTLMVRRSTLPRRATFSCPLFEGAVYGNQMVGKRKATIDRRRYCGITKAVAPDARLERRGPPGIYITSYRRRKGENRRESVITAWWSSSAKVWIPKSLLRRRKGEERRVSVISGAAISLRHVFRLPMRRKGDERRTAYTDGDTERAIRYIHKLMVRRRTDERRSIHYANFKYSSSNDPRVRALERRKS